MWLVERWQRLVAGVPPTCSWNRSAREGSLLAQAAGSMERTSLEGMPILKNAPEPEREEPGRNVGIWFPRKPAWKIHWSDTPAAQRIPALAPGASGVRTLERASCQPF